LHEKQHQSTPGTWDVEELEWAAKNNNGTQDELQNWTANLVCGHKPFNGNTVKGLVRVRDDSLRYLLLPKIAVKSTGYLFRVLLALLDVSWKL
jgi:hypothetical protein